MREEVQLWPLARVETELVWIKAWIWQHLHFDCNLGLWSQMHHDMEILEREKNCQARLECEARWSEHWSDHGQMNGSLTWTIPQLMNTLYHRTQFLQEPLLLTWLGAVKIKSYAIFYNLVSPTFLWPFPYLSPLIISPCFPKFQLLVTTSDSLVVTTFVTVLEPFTGNSPQLTTWKIWTQKLNHRPVS